MRWTLHPVGAQRNQPVWRTRVTTHKPELHGNLNSKLFLSAPEEDQVFLHCMVVGTSDLQSPISSVKLLGLNRNPRKIRNAKKNTHTRTDATHLLRETLSRVHGQKERKARVEPAACHQRARTCVFVARERSRRLHMQRRQHREILESQPPRSASDPSSKMEMAPFKDVQQDEEKQRQFLVMRRDNKNGFAQH